MIFGSRFTHPLFEAPGVQPALKGTPEGSTMADLGGSAQ